MNSKNDSYNRLKEFLDKLDPEQQEHVEKIWEEAGETDQSKNISVTEKEKNDVFANITSRTGIGAESKDVNSQPQNIRTLDWKWIAAAAIIIIAAGLSFLTIPVQYSASYGEMATVTLPDESQIMLNSGSTISYNRLFNFMDREVSLEGEAYFEVEKGEIPFVVHTSNAAVKVLGTSFNIRSWQNNSVPETSVYLTEGALAFYPAGKPDKSVTLESGQKSSFQSNEGMPKEPIELSKEKGLAWMNNHFAFEEMPMIQIIREIERRFNLNIRVEPKEILLDTLTIYYNQEVNAEKIINDICQTKALSYRKVNGGYVIEE